MPLERCGGGKGWRYGATGKCYTGRSAKKLAIKQGLAEMGPDKFKQEMSKAVSEDEVELAIAELIEHGASETVEGNHYFEGVRAYVSQKTRDKMSDDDFGDPGEKKYPIRDQKDLDSASKLIGRAPKSKQAAIKSKIKEIATRKGLSLPQSWK